MQCQVLVPSMLHNSIWLQLIELKSIAMLLTAIKIRCERSSAPLRAIEGLHSHHLELKVKNSRQICLGSTLAYSLGRIKPHEKFMEL